MMMVLMCFHHFGKFFRRNVFILRLYLSAGPLKYFLSLYTAISIFHIFSVLHHFFYIVSYPWLVVAKVSATHIAEQLLFCKSPYFIRANFNCIITNHFLCNQLPFQLINEVGKFFFYFFIALWWL